MKNFQKFGVYMLLPLLIAMVVMSSAVKAAIVYSNDFETNSVGFDSTYRISRYGSTFLRSTDGSSQTILTLNGLTVGTKYDLAFDLFIGGTWDGSLHFGPDTFSLDSSSDGYLINATFRNGFPIGDPTGGQTYSDATPLGDGGLFRTRAGADIELAEPVYYFGHGAGNPLLSFIAGNAFETLTFRSVDFQFTADEYFAIDNVLVSTEVSAVPLPPSAILFGTALLGLTGIRRRKRNVA